jgi:hypothetical protein
MLRRFLIAAAVIGAVSVGSFGMASKAEAHCGGYGGGYYGGYSAYYGPAYGPYYPGYTVAYPAVYPYSYGPYGYPPRYRHHHHDGVVVSFGY